MRGIPWGVVLGAAFLVGPALAQVEARQATPEEVAKTERGRAAEGSVEVANPMVLDVVLERKDGSNAFAVVERPDGDLALTFETTETYKFKVDRAHVASVRVKLEKPRKRAPTAPVRVKVGALLKTGYFRQDVDVTLSLLDADGKLVSKRHWDDETIGDTAGYAFGGTPKNLELDLTLRAADYSRISQPGRPNKLSILVEVQGDEDED